MEEKLRFSMIGLYTEAGVNFDEITNWQKWLEWENFVKESIMISGLMATKYLEYNLEIVESASTIISELEIVGPMVTKKDKYVSFTLVFPYARVVNDPHPLTKLTEYFKQGVAEVLRKLEYPEDSIQKVLEKINDKPIDENA